MHDDSFDAIELDALFVEFLRQGPDADIADWCRAHPAQAPRLRALHFAHRSMLAHLRAAGVRLPASAPTSTPSLSAQSSPQSVELLRRIVAQGPKGSRFRMHGELARGGMGAILRVWDEDLGRELAMKVVLGSETDSDPASRLEERMLVRFLEEAQITGQLEHPGVVPVHELGLDESGRVYFTMRLVKGRDFGHILGLVRRSEEGWNRTRALGVLLRVCEAMAYAHSKGVVHRDLKPANVMVGSFGEVYVMDWGLARAAKRAEAEPQERSDADSVHTARGAERDPDLDSSLATMQGDVLGTPAYMPPEQARGHLELVSERSDVYAIGAMLYHLLAGRAPYAAAEGARRAGEILADVLAGPPAPVHTLCDDLPPELEAICEKAMARDPEARYDGTLALGEDLRAFLEGRVVQAHQTGALVELRKWVARNRGLAAAGAAAVVFLAVGLVASLWQRGIAVENATLAADRAQEARQQEQRALRSSELAEARAGEAADSARRAEAVRDFLSGMLANANPIEAMAREVPVGDLLIDAGRRLDEGEFAADPESEFALRATLGGAFQGIGRLEESERHFRRAVELYSQRSSPDELDGLALELDLSDTLLARGAHEEVEQVARRVLARLDELGLELHPLYPHALQQLTTARYNLGTVDEALGLARSALDASARIEGEDSPSSARLRAKLAFYLVREGLLDEARVEAERAIGVLESGSPRQRYSATEAMRTLADVFRMKREVAPAIEQLERAMTLRAELLGPDHIHIADLEINLGECAVVLGRFEEAEALVRQGLETRRRVLGDHRDTATALGTLSSIQRQRGEFEAAHELAQEALEMRRRIFAPESSAIGDSLFSLGRIELERGNLAQAESLLREALANWETALGAEHQEVLLVRFELGRALRRLARFEEARVELEQALADREARFGRTHSLTWEARDEITLLLLDAGEFAEAETRVRKLLAPGMGAAGILHAYLSAQLGAALTGQERFEEAEPLLLEAWQLLGSNPAVWASNKRFVLEQLENFYAVTGDPEQAAVYRELAAGLR